MSKSNDKLFCPMKSKMSYCTDYTCDVENCAWYCTYPNGEGECAIHSIPGLFEGLQDIAKEIRIK